MPVIWLTPKTCQKVCSVIVWTRTNLKTLVGPPRWKDFQGRTLGVCYSHSDNHQRWRAYIPLLKWGVVGIFISAAVSVSVVWWEMGSLQHNLSSISTGITPDMTSPGGPYVYLWRKPKSFLSSATDSKKRDDVRFPWLQSKSDDPWTLLQLCESKNVAVRNLGVKALASKVWDDYQYRYVAQAADIHTLIGLARTKGSHPLFFLPMPALADTETPLVDELARLVLALDACSNRNGKPTNAATLAHQHLQHTHSATDDKIQFWGFSGSPLDVATVDSPVPDEVLVLHFLHAISEMTITPEQGAMLVHEFGLASLQRVLNQRSDSDTLQTVANILGNVALETRLHRTIVRAGWLGVLKAWMEGTDTALAVMAGRALANLDREWLPDVFDDGVLMLHPLYRSRKTVHADIIFVHGLRGGAIKTWRQHDSAAKQSYPKSACWPKDWLAEDCPHVRIISLHYNTALSTWSGKASTDKEKSTLEGRSKDLLSKLKQAGVGCRPIIWVGHSMGGLLIKKMVSITVQDERYRNIGDNTCGFLLYSVPHHGLSLAALTNQAHYLVYPSTEVQELSRDSLHLTQLHRQFQAFVRTRNIPCLSFGELSKTKLGKTLPKILIVPPESSDPGVGEYCKLPLDHISICKPTDCDSELYEKTLAFVHRCIFLSYMHRLRQGVAS